MSTDQTQPQQYRRRSEVVTAVQFDPTVKPWPEGVTISEPGDNAVWLWHRIPLRPGDWLTTSSEGRWQTWDPPGFAAEYEPVPSPPAPAEPSER